MALATPEQLGRRLGVTLTDAQQDHVTTLLDLATSLVLDAVDQDQAWLDAQADPPERLVVTCLEAAVRAFVNPSGARAQSESLGGHSFSQRWADGTTGLELTEREERACRRAVYGSNIAGIRNLTLADHLARSVYDAQTVVLTDPDPDVDTV